MDKECKEEIIKKIKENYDIKIRIDLIPRSREIPVLSNNLSDEYIPFSINRVESCCCRDVTIFDIMNYIFLDEYNLSWKFRYDSSKIEESIYKVISEVENSIRKKLYSNNNKDK